MAFSKIHIRNRPWGNSDVWGKTETISSRSPGGKASIRTVFLSCWIYCQGATSVKYREISVGIGNSEIAGDLQKKSQWKGE